MSEVPILEQMSHIYASEGNYKAAWKLFLEHRAVQDSLMNAQISKRVASIQLQNQIEQQAVENERLQRENKIKDLQLERSRSRMFLMLVIMLFIIGVIIVIVYVYRKKMQIKTLRGLIPICSHCKKIRNDQGYYEQLEQYISTHSDAQFSHGICNDCLKEHYPEYTYQEEKTMSGE